MIVRPMITACGLLISLSVAFHPAQQPPAAAEGRYPVQVEKNVEARMRDGTVLRADVYRPDAPGKFPALLQRTPYSKNAGGADFARRLSAQGYVVVIQDTRGRYMSDGTAVPHDEAADGYDTVEWAAALPYVDGKVGMFGGSYLATTQLTAATLRPPHLTALFPSASYASRYDMVFQGGAFYLGDGLSWNLGQAADTQRRTLDPGADRDGPIGMSREERTLLREKWLLHLPLKSLDVLGLRTYAPGYFEMLNHPSYDRFWQRFDIRARHSEIDAPALHLTGWYDTLLGGTLDNFAGLRKNARSEHARKHQRLIVGPWTHARPTRESTRIGEVDFGPDAGLDYEALLTEWFGVWLRGDPVGRIHTGAPVRIFVMGENRWREESKWPPARARTVSYHLRSGGMANSLSGDGRLDPQAPAQDPPDRFVYDPENPVPSGSSGGYSRQPSDQRSVEQRDDVLVYSTAPLQAPVEVTGPVSLILYVASSAPDTDFTGRLVDVFPDGTARALTDGILRLRYRKSMREPALSKPGEVAEIQIELGATSNLFQEGHRIRLEVSSSNFPRFDRNPNTGGTFGEDRETRPATQTLYHDRSRPSRLLLPVIPR